MSVNDQCWKYYVGIARPDHWVKHIFILPGIIAALILAPTLPDLQHIQFNCFIGFVSACLIASANYVINEWLDAETDKNHPEKKYRPAAMGKLHARYVYSEYALLAGVGIILATQVNLLFFIAAIALFISGITYNVKPFRTKDKAYLDVLSEAANNPIRLLMGWAMISAHTVPPLSLMLAYWAGGAFLMAAKRLSEYRFIEQENGHGWAGNYRRSFRFYSAESLTISCFIYAMTSIFGAAVFLIKYRTEFLVTFPIIITLFAYYLHLGLQPVSIAQSPEKLHKDWRLLLIIFALVFTAGLMSFTNIPWLESITHSHFVEIQI